MKQFKTVFLFEFTSYVKKKSYLFTTLFFMVIVVLLGNIPNIALLLQTFTGGASSEYQQESAGTVAETESSAKDTALLYDPEQLYTDEILAMYTAYNWVRADHKDESAWENSIINDEYVLVLAIDELNYTIYQSGADIMHFTMNFDDMVKEVNQIKLLAQKGVSLEETQDILNLVPVSQIVSIGKDASQTFWISYVLLLLLYMAIILYGQFVTSSVITEKTSKAMELLITSVKPVYLMFGKVIGVGMAGLAQMAAIILTGMITLSLTQSAWMAFSPFIGMTIGLSVSGSLFFYAILFFLIGFFTFAFLYAGFASTASRTEDANSVIMLPMLLFVAAFIFSILNMTNVTAPHVIICSFVPFLSPLVMFMRICVTEVPVYQILISFVINCLTVVFTGIISAKIYRSGVMMYGKKPNLKEIFTTIIRA